MYNQRSLVSFHGALVIIHTRESTLLSFYSLPPHLTMEFSASDFERLVMFEHARKACEAQYVKDKLDSYTTCLLLLIYSSQYLYGDRLLDCLFFLSLYFLYNLLQWGGALFELAQFQPIPEAKLMLDGGGGGGGGPAASSNASGGKKKNKRRRTMTSLTIYVVGSLSLVGLLLGLA
ncbi:hypothetical protein Bca4012_027027 [Brassica carinata]